MFLCEGTHLIQEALATHWPIESVCFTEEWAANHFDLLALLSPNVRQQCVSEQVLAHLATTEQPDGVIAIAKLRVSPPQPTHITLGLGVETLQEPGNLGALIRAAVATQADGLWMTPDSVDAFHPKVLRASAGQWFRQPPIVANFRPWLEKCRSQSIQILAAAAGGRSFWDFDFTKPTIFLLGNEGAGLSIPIRKLADDIVSIPMASGVESLNVGTTGALLLYEAKRQREPSIGASKPPS